MRTVIFDFGKVVAFFDHFKSLARLTPYTPMSPQEMYDLIYDNELEDAFERGAISEAEFLAEFIRLCRLRCGPELLRDAVRDIFTPNAEVCELAPRLKPRYRVLLGSNTNVIHSTHYRVQFAEVLAHFDGLILSHEIGVRKPLAGFYEACLKQANASAGECLFIDDLASNIRGAKALGMQGIVYAPGQDLAGELRRLGVVFD